MVRLVSQGPVFTPGRWFESCHASTIVLTGADTAVAAWFAGTRESAGDVAIWISRSGRPAEGTWTDPEIVADDKDLPHWNPVLFAPDERTVELFYKTGPSPREWRTMRMRSEDSGATFGAAEPFLPEEELPRGPVKNKPIRLSTGEILAPGSVETATWDCFVDRIDPDGIDLPAQMVPIERLPGRVESVSGQGLIQPSLWESAPGVVHLLARSTEGRIFRSDSADAGTSWTTAYPIDLPNNNSGLDLDVVRAPGAPDRIYLACNPVAEDWGPRYPLTLFESPDNGASWSEALVLESEPGQYSYPAVVTRGTDVHITYTWNRETIVHAVVEAD